MTFRELLSTIVDQTPGAVAGAIMGQDGIAIDEYMTAKGLDLSAVAVESDQVLTQARKVCGSLFERPDDRLEELVLTTRSHQLLFREIDREYFLIVVLDRHGVLGKARYLVGSALQELREEL